MAKIKTPDASTLERDIRLSFEVEPEREWRDHIDAVVADLKIRRGGKQD